MKLVKIKVRKPFGDHKAGLIRQIGEVFEVTKDRLEELARGVPADFYEEVKTSKPKTTED